jgi:hypothetical protein
LPYCARPPETAEDIATISIQNTGRLTTAGVIQVGKLAPALFAAEASGRGVVAASVQRVKADGSSRYEEARKTNR